MDATRILEAPADAGEMVVRKTDDAGALQGLRAEWADLIETSHPSSIFLTWEWLSTWWAHLSGGRRLSLITIRRHGRLVAVAPLMVSPPRYTRLDPFPSVELLGVGDVGSDYMDLIVRRGEEEAAAAALAEVLARGRLMVRLARVTPGSHVVTALVRHLRRRGWTCSMVTSDVCPFITLAGHTWESYLATLDRNHRHDVQYTLRRLTRQFDVRFERARSEAERREFLSLLVALHHRRWGGRGGSTAFHTRDLFAFHEELTGLALDLDWLRLFILRLGGTPVAALYGFHYRRAFSFYQAGFDPAYRKYSVGTAMVALTIKQAIEEGAEEYDLLHGDEPYKFEWARERRELARIELYPPRLRGLLNRSVVDLGRAVRKLARHAVPLRGSPRLDARISPISECRSGAQSQR